MIDITSLDGTAQAELVRNNEVTPLELLDAAIARIEAANPAVNAVITTMYDEGREMATSPLPDGPFTGVPFVLKDGGGSAFAGVRLTSGSKYLMDYVAPADGELCRRYKQAGLVMVGKSNMPEFGMQPTTEPTAFGPTRNPWDPELSAGGSSGGATAAVATRMVAMASASDSGGSIRVPAAHCGVFGMKPTRSRISSARRTMGVSMRVAMLSEHAVTISVRDSAALLDATAGPMPGDPWQAPRATRPYAAEVGEDPKPLRIVFSTLTPSGAPLHPDCLAAVTESAKLCEELGHQVFERNLKLEVERLAAPFTAISAAGVAWDVRNWERKLGKPATADQFEPETWAMIERGRSDGATAEQLMDALVAMQEVADDVTSFIGDDDVWLTPTTAAPPPPLGSFRASADDPMQGLRTSGLFTAFTALINVTGQPAMSVPLFWTADNVPVGSHFVGRYGDESTLFALAGQLERARPWAGRIPATAA